MIDWLSYKYFVYVIGFAAQILFSARLLLQWIQSEKVKKVLTPELFWQLSLMASFLLFIYGWLRDDFAIMLGQSLTYFIYIRNMQLQGSWKKLPSILRGFLFGFPFLIAIYSFNNNQIDIDITSDMGKEYLTRILKTFSENNIKMIRLDAAGYALKKAGTSCFMLDETFEFIDELSKTANDLGIETLVEIHSYYQTQIEIAKRVDRVYDFALPPLVLHSIFSKDFTALTKWLKISPKNCITVLDTHDGIGIIDVGPMNGKPGLLNNDEIDNLVETIHVNSKGESQKATGAAASNVDLYQVNCTYYDALGQNDFDYLVARAIQFFSPGTPQVYYAGLLAEKNAMELLSKSNVGRDINRPYLDSTNIEKALNKPFTKAMVSLIQLRNNCDAFNGEFTVNSDSSALEMKWKKDEHSATLIVDLANRSAQIQITEKNDTRIVCLNTLLN